MEPKKLDISLIIPISKDVSHLVDFVSEIHRQQTIEFQIIFSYNDETPFNLARARNRGAKLATSKWLIFSDFDTFYQNHLFEDIIKLNKPIIAGKSRGDVETINDQPLTYYHCGFAPLLIQRSLFESIGGYCEKYTGYGYEDSDIEWKLDNINVYESKALHVLPLHRMTSIKPEWKWGSDDNRILFEERMKLSKEERINNDRLIYNG